MAIQMKAIEQYFTLDKVVTYFWIGWVKFLR